MDSIDDEGGLEIDAAKEFETEKRSRTTYL
jgi:hypothetical protein